jgi:hypothetical protein
MNPESNNSSKALSILLSFISPSAIGMTIYIIIFLSTFLAEQNSQINLAIRNFNKNNLEGTIFYGLINQIERIINNQTVNTIAVYIFWIIVASFVYFIGLFFYKSFHELSSDFIIKKYLWPAESDKNSKIRDFLEKFGLRFVIFIMIIIYIFKFLPVLTLFLKKNNLKYDQTFHYLGIIVMVAIVEFIFLQFAIILLRLLFLRKRVIGI